MTAQHITVTDYRQLGGTIIGGEYCFPVISTTTSTGKTQTWQICVSLRKNDTFIPIKDEYFDQTWPMDDIVAVLAVKATTTTGKPRSTAPTLVKSGKNLGKKNATNVFGQALRDALSKHNAQAKSSGKKNYTGKRRFYPMLAQQFKPGVSKNAGWLSPKLDGLRVVATWDYGCVFYSRTLGDYPPITPIVEELTKILSANKHLYLDGEMYIHGVALQTINSVVRSETSVSSELANKLQYCVYDCFLADEEIVPMKFSERLAMLRDLFAKYNLGNGRVVLVTQTQVSTLDEINANYERYLSGKYEGVMLRLDENYDSRPNNYHSKYLLKYKPTLDDEFEVVGWTTSDVGKSTGALMMKFVTPGGKEFMVTPAMEIEERIELAKKMPAEFDSRWRGKKLTVYYASLSADGVPLQPRTKLQGRFD